MNTNAGNCNPCPLEAVLATAALKQRSSQPPNYQKEAEALRRLSAALGNSPETILDTLVEEIKCLTTSGSAGLSLTESEDGVQFFRWRAIAGELSPFLNGTMPRYFSPCGVVVDSNAVQLMIEPVRHYPYIEKLGLPLYEVLLVPFTNRGVTVGTLWAVAHNPGQHFDHEDSRIIHSLAEFASAAIGLYLQAEQLKRQKEELKQNRKKLTDILTAIPVGIAILEGPDFRIGLTNKVHTHLYGGGDDFEGKTVADSLPEHQKARILELLTSVYTTGNSYQAEDFPVELVQANGQTKLFYVSFSYLPLRDPSDRIYGVLATTLDVTDKVLSKNIAQEKKRSDSQNRETFEGCGQRSKSRILRLEYHR
ncbi:MAG: PAS domain-containing protein [Pseudobdellovibrionaceae bacterium]|nr:PAS domain-containing protein [Pseudobdellovibrionaceae bacterium]